MNTARARFLAPALVVLIAACGREDGGKAASQVAARVNAGEITVHQLNNALAQVRNLDPEQQKAAARQVLERMIDQELLVQKAIERKLDREPRVLQAMEASRRQILSQAYLDQLSAQAQRPDADEIRKFYRDRPELFAERKVYRLQELSIPARPELTAQLLEEQVRKAKSLNDVVGWLKSINVPFNANSTVKAAEQLPLEVLPRLAQLQVGQVMMLPTQQTYLLMQLAASENKPLDEKQAKPFIEQYLMNQRRLELARGEVKSLRDAARIQYVGAFAANAPPKPEPPARAAGPADKSAIDKGVAGLR